MLKRGRISEGWLGELYAGEDAQGRLLRFVSLADFSETQRQWVLERIRLMNMTSVHGAIPQLGIHVIQGEPCWVGAWRDAVQLSAVLESKHIPNTVIMAVAFGLLQSLYSAEQKGISHGALHPNAIWLGLDGAVWIDGYGCPSIDGQSADDIYDLGCVLIEMFLGNNPFPVAEEEHTRRIREVGLELQAMGLPNKLPRQILTLLHPNPAKRPTAELLVNKWKLTRANPIVSSWIRSQFPTLQSGKRPEDRIPTTDRIAPLPFPELLNEVEEDLEIPPLLDEDDTILNPQAELTVEGEVDIEMTQEVPIYAESADLLTDEPTEETQATQFLEDFEENFFDAEPTSKLIVDEYLSVEETKLEVGSVELREEMPVESRRLLAGIVWFCAVVVMTFGGMYIIVPAVPAYPEKQSLLEVTDAKESDEKTAVDVSSIPSIPAVPVIQPQDEIQDEVQDEPPSEPDSPPEPVGKVENEKPPPKVDVVVKAQPQPKKSNSQPIQKKSRPQPTTNQNTVKNSPKPESEPVKTISLNENEEDALDARPDASANGWGSTADPSGQSTEEKPDKDVEDKSGEVIDASEEDLPPPPPEPPPEPPSGTVSVAGEVKKVRIESKGRDVPLGSVPPGVYTVFATFEGFSEFKVTTLTVEDGKKYTIFCVPTFATCKIK